MIKSNIQIENDVVMDFYDAFGFIYVDADERTAPDEKQDAVSSYAEEAGEYRDGRTVYAPFDYTAKFIIEAPNKDLTNVNAKIKAFNDAIRADEGGVLRKRKISFYNLLNRVKIVGYPELISVPTKVYHSNAYGGLDFALVELKIRVSNPKECNFNLPTDNSMQTGVQLNLTTDGTNIFVNTSRELKEGEVLLLLRNGRARNRYTSNKKHFKSKYKWHVMAIDGGRELDNILDDDRINRGVLSKCRFYASSTKNMHGVKCRKASGSKYFYRAQTGLRKKITFGCAVYQEGVIGDKIYIPRRISNVVYFTSNVTIDEQGTNMNNMRMTTWLEI